jgi:hypothetical protein
VELRGVCEINLMAKRGRAPGFEMSNDHRVKIQNSNILNALIEHATGKREMAATQVTAGLGLLKKVMPDLSSVEMSADVTMTHEQFLDTLIEPDGETPPAQG